MHGSLKIDSVKITSWDPTTNNYATTNGSREAVPPGTIGATPNGYIVHYGAPRGFIKIEHDATGTTDITNSDCISGIRKWKYIRYWVRWSKLLRC